MILLAQGTGQVADLTGIYAQLIDFIINQGPGWLLRICAALGLLLIGWILSGIVKRLSRKSMERASLDSTLSKFLSNIVYAFVIALSVVTALNTLGINTTSLAAVIGAAGLAIGLALQDSLGNFASGVMLIILRPFKEGDYVECGGTNGIVSEIHVFHTVLKSPNNQRIVVPNGEITSGIITNYSTFATRRVDLTIGCSYDDDLRGVKQFLEELAQNDPRVLAEPAPEIRVSELGSSSVNFIFRAWTVSGDWWATRCDMLEAIKLGFDQRGFNLPYPQQDIHIISNESSSDAA